MLVALSQSPRSGWRFRDKPHATTLFKHGYLWPLSHDQPRSG